MSVEEFITYLQDHIAGDTDTLRGYTAQETAAIDRLRREKYSTWQWNYGHSPRYGLNQTRRFPWGFIEVSLDVSGGLIRTCSIRGDYFFTRPTEEVEQALTGLPHTHDAVLRALSALPLADYFGPATADELAELFL